MYRVLLCDLLVHSTTFKLSPRPLCMSLTYEVWRNVWHSKKNEHTLEPMPVVHPHAAGIDGGAEEHWVCIPADRDAQPIQRFSAVTCDLASSGGLVHCLSCHHGGDGIDRHVLDSPVSDP